MTPATKSALRFDTPFSVPQISQDELFAFHRSHFSAESLIDFGQNFMNPKAATASRQSHATQVELLCQENQDYQAEEEEEEEDDDDLGYYEDGVKRTLTDEQIAIFRHSELRELQRHQERAANANAGASLDGSSNDSTKTHSRTPGSIQPADVRSSKKNKKKKNVPRKEPKPDLRKRTWDVVEAGLDSLDYD